MEILKDFLLDNYGLVGLIIFALLFAIIFMAKYILKLHKIEKSEYKAEKEEWKKEREKFRDSLDKNSIALEKTVNSIEVNTNLVKELNVMLKTINSVNLDNVLKIKRRNKKVKMKKIKGEKND